MKYLRCVLVCALLVFGVGSAVVTAGPDQPSSSDYDYRVYPWTLEFDALEVGETSGWKNIRIENHSGEPVHIFIPEVLGDFHFMRPGEFVLTSVVYKAVEFRPQTAGAHSSTLSVFPDNDFLWANVVLKGQALHPFPAAGMDCEARDFGMVPVGETVAGNVCITNLGNTVIGGTVTVSGEGFRFAEEDRDWSVPKGGFENFTIHFSPEVAGQSVGSIDFGSDLCCAVELNGTGMEVGGQTDLICIYFEQSGLVNHYQTTGYFEEVTAYLAVANPSFLAGIVGWECCVEMAGAGTGLTVELAGEALNIEMSPCFTVGMIDGALPPGSVINLATLRFLQPDPEGATWFYIHPTTRPSIPGVPCYVDRMDEGLQIPLGWSSGSEAVPVASVNDPEISGVDEPPPAVVRDLGNYPNPFNPGTTISFVLGAETPVTLRVYDLGGRCVRSLLGGEVLGAGRCEVPWDGLDESGRMVAAGAYFYRLDAGEYRETKRMMLVK